MSDATAEDGKMATAEILQALEYFTEQFPKRAVQQAIAQREIITPKLLSVLEEVAADPGTLDEYHNYSLPVYALFLLAQFRETRAYRPIMQLISADTDIVRTAFFKSVIEVLPRLLCSIYDGDPEPLKRLVEDTKVNDFSRMSAVAAFPLLVQSGQMPREEAVEYYRDLFEGRLERETPVVWSSFVVDAAEAFGEELLNHVRKAFEDKSVISSMVTYQDIESFWSGNCPHDIEPPIITDTIEEMEYWAFNEPAQPAPEEWTRSTMQSTRAMQSVMGADEMDSWRNVPASKSVQPRVKVGRNEPCSCGSGKKYKKCCGSVA